MQTEQKAADAGVPKDSLASIQDNIRAAKTALDSMTTDRPNFFELRQQALGDTTRTDTTSTRPDTTGTDSTRAATTRGIGGRPDGTFVPAGQLGMTTGGVGGGGAADPSSSIILSSSTMALRAQAMGAANVGQVPDSTLVDRAFGVAVQRSPQEAQRRLDGLVQQGRLDPARRDSIIRKIERK